MATAIPNPNEPRTDVWGRPYQTSALPADFSWEEYDKRNPELRAHWNATEDVRRAYGNDYQRWMEDDLYQNLGSLSRRWPTTTPPPGGTTGDGGGGGNGGGGEEGGGGGDWSGYAQNVNDLITGFRNPISAETTALAKEQIAYTSRRLTEIEQARKLGNMTGTLTSDEKRMFQEMEDSAVANLKSQVNAQTQDVWNTALSDLVNRGVLQGTVGERILGVISSENVRTVAEGVNTIQGQMNLNRINVQETNKNRALTWDNMLSQESLGLLGIGSGYAKDDLTSQLQRLGLGVNANLNFAGLTSQEGIAAENRALTGSEGAANRALQEALTKSQLQNQWNIANLDAQTRLGISGLQAGAATTASQYGMYGNLGAAGLLAAAKYGPSAYNALTSGNTPTTTTPAWWSTGYTNEPAWTWED